MKQFNKNLIKYNLLILLLGGSISNGFSQTKELKLNGKFSILVETMERNIKFTSVEGCVWKDLTLSLENDIVLAIDKYGVISEGAMETKKKNDSSNFVITVQKIKDGIELLGKKGTAWERLSFRCPKDRCQEYIDQNGRI